MDIIFGDVGGDQLFGDAGADEMDAGGGNDTVRGGTGNDQILGGTGDDSLRADGGQDDLKGGAGDDTLFGGQTDTMFEFLSGGADADSSTGGPGSLDVLRGGPGRDVLDGMDGADTVRDDDGADKLFDCSDNMRGVQGSATGSVLCVACAASEVWTLRERCPTVAPGRGHRPGRSRAHLETMEVRAMTTLLRRRGGYAIALLVGMVLSGAPSAVAAVYDAVNSDKVDGKHAVGVGASSTERAGKLVATGSTGRLPNNIISKAADANKLDGRDSDAYLSGYERITVQSAFDDEKFKSVTVVCPEGKKVTGGGFHMSFGAGAVRWDNANVWNNHPLTEGAWIVSANTAIDGTWQLNGYAICVRTG